MRVLGNDASSDEEPGHRAPKPLHEQALRNRRQRHERPARTESPVGGKDVHVRVEVREIPKGLHEQDRAQQPRTSLVDHAVGSQPQRLRQIAFTVHALTSQRTTL